MTKHVVACVGVLAIVLTAGCTISAETDPPQTDAEKPVKTVEVKPAPGRPTFEPLRDPKIPDDELEFHFLEGDATDGLIWQWWMLPEKQYWTFDAIEVDCSLLSTSDKDATFELLADELRLVLTPAGKQPIVKTLKAPFGQHDTATGLGKTSVQVNALGEIFELH